MRNQDLFWMEKAYLLALKAQEENEVPVGALLVSTDNLLLGQGSNAVIQKQDPTAHAEILALQEAGKKLGNYRLEETTLYVTLEPCPMCAGALVQARIKRLVFATRDFKSGAAGSVYNLLKGFPLNHQVQIDEGPLQKPCSVLLIDFFQKQRSDRTY